LRNIVGEGDVGGVGSAANPSPTLYFPSSFIPYIISANIPAVSPILATILKKYVL